VQSLPVEDSRDTDAPLSRSLAVRFPNLRRRHLFAFAGGGVLLGVLLTLILLSSSDDRDAGRESRVEPAAPAASPVESVPRQLVTPGPPAPVPAPVVENPVMQEDSESRNDGRRTGRASSTSKEGDPRKRPPPPPKRPKPTSPDYGI
jgi:hypothetical protein